MDKSHLRCALDVIFFCMDKVRWINYKGNEIFVIDYSGCNENEMIEILYEAKRILLQENKKVLILDIVGKRNYVTPKYINVLKKEMKFVEPFILKNAVVGLSDVQVWILKGINLWAKTKIVHFKSKEEALEYLVSD